MVWVRRNEEDWVQLYRENAAYWQHSGDPTQPHVILSGGDHSSGFFNSELVLQNPMLVEDMARELMKKLVHAGFGIGEVDRVIGPVLGAVTLADILALIIGKRRGRPCLRGFAESAGEGAEKKFFLKRTKLQIGERVLVCEDVTTRVESVAKAAEAVREAGGKVMPFYPVLVNRSGRDADRGRKIIALVNRHLPQWPSDACPLCKQGSEPLRPKGKEEWARLTSNQ